VREYASFSWPLFGYHISNLVVVQGVMLVGARSVGIAGVGAIAFVSSISAFAERVDQVVSETIYPAICAVADRTELLLEAFVKSNRLALMWGMPFGVGLALFAHDLVHFVFGDEWVPAIGLLAAFGLIAGVRQIAFNWQIFMRAVNDTKPIFYVALGNLITFFVITVPLIIVLGLTGFALGMAAITVIQIGMRGYFLRRLFKDFRITTHLVRAIAPSIPAAGAILLLRLVVPAGRTPSRAVAEVVLYAVVTAVATWFFEREFLREIGGYMRGRGGGIRTRAKAADARSAPVPSGRS
jgi:O-antigen/teichoic acid export membrane protein